MKAFIIGVSGAVGRLLARDLVESGDDVAGLVRREEKRADLSRWGVDARVGELVELAADSLAAMLNGVDALVYTAGSNGGGEGVVKALEPASSAGVDRFALVSVTPEAGRGIRGGPPGSARRVPGDED